MIRIAFACALALAVLSACSGTGALLYCLANDHNPNRRCQ